MIQSSLLAARDMLRRHLGRRANGEEIAHVTCPGRGIGGPNNYLGLMYIGLERETNLAAEAQGVSMDANVVFMLYAVFSDYGESLRMLSQALAVYQSHLALEPAAFPDLKLSRTLFIEPYFFPLVEQLQTWNPFMDDSIPFMFYRLRSLSFKTAHSATPPVRDIPTNFKKAG